MAAQTPLVPSIVEVLMNKIALWISNRGNDWTAESAMIASNAKIRFFTYDKAATAIQTTHTVH